MGPQAKLAIIPDPEFTVGTINDWKRVSDEGKTIFFGGELCLQQGDLA
jgi:hypothetical protein